MQQYREHTTKVRQVYDKLFYGDFFDAGEDAAPEWYMLAAGITAGQTLLTAVFHSSTPIRRIAT